MKKIVSTFIAIIMFLFPALNIPEAEVDKNIFKTAYTNIFVHGFAGWGEYNALYKAFPYWGAKNGDLMKYLNARGFDCHAATVSPTTSAWDRACELYAELTGTVTDYGKAHSESCNHKRFGKDYSKSRLIEKWSAKDKINLFGHSFGGATVRMLAHLMANGSEEERKASNDVSELFKGGKSDWIYSIVTLSAPHNGTSSYDIQESLKTDPNASKEEQMIAKVFMSIGSLTAGGRTENDTAIYEMQIDNALALNKKIETLENVYYFSYSSDGTKVDENGVRTPDENYLKSSMYVTTAKRICSYTGVTPGGYVIDEKWQPNDGLVNTYSAMAPIGAPAKEFDASNITTGIWNVMPVQKGDHTTLQGGMNDSFNGRLFFVDLLTMINTL